MTTLYASSPGRITQEYLDEQLPQLVKQAEAHALVRVVISDDDSGLMVDYYLKTQSIGMRYRHRVHPSAPASRDQYFNLTTEPPLTLDQAYEVAAALATIKDPINTAKKMLVDLVRSGVVQLGQKFEP